MGAWKYLSQEIEFNLDYHPRKSIVITLKCFFMRQGILTLHDCELVDVEKI